MKSSRTYVRSSYNTIMHHMSRAILHPQYDSRRLSNDIAILRLNRRVNLQHAYVGAACLPACEEQFR